MSSATASETDSKLPRAGLRRFAWVVLAYFVAVILWGTLVRATGSGAGCGGHWPLCNGTIVQQSASAKTMIEYTHRIMSGISLLAIVGLAVWTFSATARGHLARLAATIAVILTLVEAILGALLVKLGLTATSHSPLRPAYLALHLTNTLLLLAALTLTAHLLGRRTGYLRGSVRLVAPFGIAACILVVLLVGVTGSLAALGDTLFPASSLNQALAQDFSPTSGWLVHWRWMHPAVAFTASIFLVWLLARSTEMTYQRSRPGPGPATGFWNNRRLSALVLLLLVSVYALGILDVALLAPVWVQVAHLLGADTLWITLVVLAARLTLVPQSGNQ
ncbi:MAG: COX15/CtaA family protein [Terracidiphilus sp.]